jgi:hypothetical protein
MSISSLRRCWPSEVCRGAEFVEGVLISNSLESPFDKGGAEEAKGNRVRRQVPASVWGIPNSVNLPSRLGARELIASAQTAPVGFAPLYPPYTWIPASAGMTGHGAAGRCREFEGVPQLPFFVPPRMGVRGLNTLRPIQRKHLAQIALHDASPMVEGRC